MSATEMHTVPIPVIAVPASRPMGLPILFCDATALTPGTAMATAVQESPFIPVISSGPAGESAGVHRISGLIPGWPKLPVLEQWASGRRFVWADADTRTLLVTAPLLALPLDPRTGLTAAHLAAAVKWVRTSAFTDPVTDRAATSPTEET